MSGSIVTVSRTESGMLFKAAEMNAGKADISEVSGGGSYAVTSQGLRTTPPGLNTKPAFMSKGVQDS